MACPGFISAGAEKNYIWAIFGQNRQEGEQKEKEGETSNIREYVEVENPTKNLCI